MRSLSRVVVAFSLSAGAASCSRSILESPESQFAGGQSNGDAATKSQAGGTGGAGVRDSGGLPSDAATYGDPVRPDPFLKALAGHWVRLEADGCNHEEDWFTFALPSGFTHTRAERNQCFGNVLSSDPGKITVSGHTLDLEWGPEQGGLAQRRMYTVAVVPDYVDPSVATPLPDSSYLVGTRSLNLATYFRRAGDTIHRRADLYEAVDPTGAMYQTVLAVDLSVTPLPDQVATATPCELSFTIDVTVHSLQADSNGKQSFSFPCKITPTGPQGWMMILADGFGKDPSGVAAHWVQYVNWYINSTFSLDVRDLMAEGFEPLLFYLPGDPSSLFNKRWWQAGDGLERSAWLVEMKSPPPTSLP